MGLIKEGERYAVVSETAVLWGADGAYVWSIVDGKAMRTPVRVVQRREGRVLIDGSLDAGGIVVVEGLLVDGAGNLWQDDEMFDGGHLF